MGTVGIVTIDDDTNLGNRLQNYALQETLRQLGWDTETVRNSPPPMSRRLLASRALHALRADGPVRFIARNAGVVAGRFSRRGAVPAARYAGRRREAIARFAQKHITHSREVFEELLPQGWASRYDVAVVGSDQVWNYGFRNAQGIDFLTFMPPERRVAYAASFGVHDIPEFLRVQYATWLQGIPHISVREARGAQIVAELTGRTVPVVLDPTLLLDRERWSALAECHPELEGLGAYAVQFFLGPVPQDVKDWAARTARESGLALVDLNDLEHEEFAALGPAEFVGALGEAELVVTNSFHAGVFATIQHTPTVVRPRHHDDTRLSSLFASLGIKLVPTEVPGLERAVVADRTAVDEALARERSESLRFLKESLEAATGEEPR